MLASCLPFALATVSTALQLLASADSAKGAAPVAGGIFCYCTSELQEYVFLQAQKLESDKKNHTSV